MPEITIQNVTNSYEEQAHARKLWLDGVQATIPYGNREIVQSIFTAANELYDSWPKLASYAIAYTGIAEKEGNTGKRLSSARG